MTEITASEVRSARAAFYGGLMVDVVVILAIHLLPKNHAPRDMLRLVYTVGLFTACIALCLRFGQPRAKYQELFCRWSFHGAPEAIQRTWQSYLHALNSFLTVFTRLVILLLGATAATVLDDWFPAFQVLSPLVEILWWAAVAMLAGYTLGGGSALEEIFRQLRQLRLQTTLEAEVGFVPRTVKDLYVPQATAVAPATLAAEAEERFQAGGQEWRWEDFYQNGIVSGQTGSGKTECVLNSLLEGLLASTASSALPPGGLALDPKGELKVKLPALARRYGREKDLLVLNPNRPDRSAVWNLFDSDDSAADLTTRFLAAMQSAGHNVGASLGQQEAMKKLMQHLLTLLRLTNSVDEPPDSIRLGQLLADPDEIAWRLGQASPDQPHAGNCLNYFAREWPEYPPEEQTRLRFLVAGLVEPFTEEPYRELFNGASTFQMSDLATRGSILYLYMPVSERTALARTVGMLLKLEFYREVLRRPGKERASFFLCDEFQIYLSARPETGDADFFERSRQSRHANLVTTQNLSGLRKQTGKPDWVENLLANCAVQIFLRNSDQATNEYASRLFGESREAGLTTGGAGARRIPPGQFLGLAIPSLSEGRDFCEAYIHQGARPAMQRSHPKSRWGIHPIEPGGQG